MNRNWYAVYTKPQSEMRVVNLLSKKKIETFCPHKRMIVGPVNKRKMVYEPMFPSFVFVHIHPSQAADIRKTSDVLNFVYWLGSPVVITPAEIENIARFNGQYFNIELEKSPVNMGGSVKIINENGEQTDLMSFTSAKVKLQLPSLGFTLYAEGTTTPEMAHAFEEKEAAVLA